MQPQGEMVSHPWDWQTFRGLIDRARFVLAGEGRVSLLSTCSDWKMQQVPHQSTQVSLCWREKECPHHRAH